MTLQTRTSITSIALGASLMVGAMLPGFAFAGDKVTIYFTRHAEKQALLTEADDGHLYQPKDTKGAEELNKFGEARAEALADWFFAKGITSDLTHIFSSQKLRTRQTIAAIAVDALDINGNDLLTSNDMDYLPGDGIQQFPAGIELCTTVMNTCELDMAIDYDGRLETLDSPGFSVDPTVEALNNLPEGSVALVAMHSGTFYDILGDLGITTPVTVTDEGLFPKGEDGKISTFGDIWKVQIKNNVAEVKWRKNLQFEKYKVAATYTD